MDGEQIIGVVVSKLEEHRNGVMRGYIAMLAVKEQYRGKGIGTLLPLPLPPSHLTTNTPSQPPNSSKWPSTP